MSCQSILYYSEFNSTMLFTLIVQGYISRMVRVMNKLMQNNNDVCLFDIFFFFLSKQIIWSIDMIKTKNWNRKFRINWLSLFLRIRKLFGNFFFWNKIQKFPEKFEKYSIMKNIRFPDYLHCIADHKRCIFHIKKKIIIISTILVNPFFTHYHHNIVWSLYFF